MVDIETIEPHKENITQISAGRPAHDLVSWLSLPSDEINKDLIARKEQLKQQFGNLSLEDDPLKWYIELLDLVDQAKTQGNKALYKAVLEDCVSEFCTIPQYKNDARFASLWVKLCELSEDPIYWYKRMFQYGVGTELALFYEAYSRAFERMGRWNEAERVYMRGINTNARPVKRLLLNYKKLKQRIESDRQAEKTNALESSPLSASMFASPHLRLDSSIKCAKRIPIYIDGTSQNESQLFPNKDEKVDSIISENYKENGLQAGPWQGQMLKQDTFPCPQKTLQIYLDPDRPRSAAHSQPKRVEELKAFTDLIYQDIIRPGGRSREEFSFEEILLQTRNLRNHVYPRPPEPGSRRMSSQGSNAETTMTARKQLDSFNLDFGETRVWGQSVMDPADMKTQFLQTRGPNLSPDARTKIVRKRVDDANLDCRSDSRTPPRKKRMSVALEPVIPYDE